MVAQGNVAIAFALVIGAGLSTTLGASFAFFAKLAEPIYLAAGLGISAGVMLYVSFVEIFMQKGVTALTTVWGEAGYPNATLFFFAGIAFTAALDKVVHYITMCIPDADESILDKRSPSERKADALQAKLSKERMQPDLKSADSPPADLEEAVEPTTGILQLERKGPEAQPSTDPPIAETEDELPVVLANVPEDMTDAAAKTIDTYMSNDHHRYALKKMGLMTAIAIGVHNLPEGLATFVAALADPLNGVAIAVAIALHNIPEGVCVAMPVYYATGSRWKGFMWAFVSGLSEPIGGLIGWAVLYGHTGDLAYGILFTTVGGMMTYISIKELIPTALKYDPHDRVTSTCIIFGMVIMAASLLMFTI